jgi:glycosyltransferase involved in cell wall biosynthesis
VTLRRTLKHVAWRATVERDIWRARRHPIDLGLFHEFAPPPAGGGHQALRALMDELKRRGVVVELQTISPQARACLFNSFNFDRERLELMTERADGPIRMVHRVGAVTSLYRGYDDGTDALVGEINHRLADATIAISRATIEMYRQIGIELIEPHVIYNPCDRRIFHPDGRVPFRRDRRTRLISTAWSDNPKKGAPVFAWLERELDPARFDLTFVGNSPVRFERARHIPPVTPIELASLLRDHDVFVTATENDAYSNALVEALSCGLPAIYLDSGGSREAVNEAGFAFTTKDEILHLLDRLVDEYEARQAGISLPSLDEIVDRYLDVLGLDEYVRAREETDA